MTRKSRPGARGVRKVSTGCLTCKIRHKKCDEARPACSVCTRAGWKCDFGSSSSPRTSQGPPTPPIRSMRFPYARPLLNGEHEHMEFFQVVSAREFPLFFELPAWESIILQGAFAEPALHHAALSIGALTRNRYYPHAWQTHTAIPFSIRHYNGAIQHLHRRLDVSSQSLELAVLMSIVFSFIEFLLGHDSKVQMHVQAGSAMLESLYARHDSTLSVSSRTGSNCQVGSLSPSYSLLAAAISHITAQFNSFVAFQSNSNNR